MKLKRHEKIIELVNKYEIETQEELASLLNQAGFRVTQATWNFRDLQDVLPEMTLLCVPFMPMRM